jgi:hypothetical protein
LPSRALLASEGRVSARNSLPSRRERKGIVHAGLAHLWSMAVSSLLFCGTFGQRDATDIARERPKSLRATLELIHL